MSRSKLPGRRPSVTEKVPVALDGGKDVQILVTVGFDDADRPREVFCASFKAGTVLNTAVMDACILMSRLLQHGDRPQDLVAALTPAPGLIGAIAKAVDGFEGAEGGIDVQE